MKLSFNEKITEADFPKVGEAFSPRFVKNFADMARQLSQLAQGNVSLGDNCNGTVLTLKMAHGVPQLVSKPLANGATPLGVRAINCDTQAIPSLVMSTTATVNGVVQSAGAGSVWLTALYPVPITDWVSYTPTGSWTTNTAYAGKWRRVGDTLEAQVIVTLSGAPNAATALNTISLPSTLLIDSTKLINNSLSQAPLGAGVSLANGAGFWSLFVGWGGGQAILITTVTAVGTSGAVSTTSPAVYKNGDFVQFNFRVPVAGWGISSATANVTLFIEGA